MEMSMENRVEHPRQRGFALILALLALMLLTFLGLTLATTTSTELQIATNYRWSQQAYYNAEAGIEAAKIILRDVPNDWHAVLPPALPDATLNPTPPPGARAAWAAGAAPPKCGPAPYGSGACGTAPVPGATRNWEGVDCDTRSGTGYGVVLSGAGPNLFTQSGAPTGAYEHVTSFQGQPVNGAFTLWVRRDLVPPAGNAFQLQDDQSGAQLILTSEGVAPAPMNVPGVLQQAGRAVRLLQVKLTRGLILNPCEAQANQGGATASGSNFGACVDALNLGATENTGVK
jgi:hypothetical protein